MHHHGDDKEHASCQNLDKSFWTETICYVVYTQNKCVMRAFDSIMYVEVWSGKNLTLYIYMRVFKCVVYGMMLDGKRDKLDANNTKCLCLSYFNRTKAYRLMCWQTKNIIKNKIVVIMEG